MLFFINYIFFPQMDVFNGERKMIGLEFIKSMFITFSKMILYLLNNTTEFNEHLFFFEWKAFHTLSSTFIRTNNLRFDFPPTNMLNRILMYINNTRFLLLYCHASKIWKKLNRLIFNHALLSISNSLHILYRSIYIYIFLFMNPWSEFCIAWGQSFMFFFFFFY